MVFRFFLLISVSCFGVFVANSQESCNRCRQCVSDVSRSSLCKCDSACEIFRDCCASSSAPASCNSSQISPLQSGVVLECRSIYLNPGIPVLYENEAFLMVASCPDSWHVEQSTANTIASNCVSQDLELPPVTDRESGIVYKNEHCALCNGIRQLVAWQPNLACTPNVYQLLQTQPLSQILRNNPRIFQTECQGCSYQIPRLSSIPSPRSCVPRVSTCLSKGELEKRIRRTLTRSNYTDMVERCETGFLDLVTASNVVYRNRACALCNGEDEEELQCTTLGRQRETVPDQCAPSPPTQPTERVTRSPTPPSTTERVTRSPPTTMQRVTALPITKPPLPSPLPFTLVFRTIAPFTFRPRPGVRPRPNPKDIIAPVVPRFRPFTVPPPVMPEPDGIIAPIAPPPVMGIPFTITLSNLGGGQVIISTESDTIEVPVNCPPGEAPIGLQCRPTQCPQSYSQTGGRCTVLQNPSNGGSLNCSTTILALNESEYTDLGNDTILYQEQELVVIERDQLGRPLVCTNISNTTMPEVLNCSTGLLPLNESEYQDLGNNTITYDGELIEVMYYDDLGRPLICPDNESVVEVTRNRTIHSLKSLPGVGELTYIGCSLSVLGTLVILITYGLFSELRTLPSKILMNLSVCLLATSLLFIIGGPVVQRFPNPDLCTAVAICLHFFYLAQFTWMSIFSFEMARSFHRASEFIVDSARKKYQLLLGYLIFGWSLPVIIGVTCIGLNFSGRGLVLYGVLSDGRVGSCWINHFTSFIVAFLVPLLLSIVTNLVTFVVVTVLLCKASRNKSKLSKSNHSALIRVWLAILSITGLTWIFGFISIPNQGNWATYPFVIFNSSQGFIIFIAFLATKKTLLLYRDLLTGRRSKKSSSPKQNSSITNSSQIKSQLSKKEFSSMDILPSQDPTIPKNTSNGVLVERSSNGVLVENSSNDVTVFVENSTTVKQVEESRTNVDSEV